MAAVSSPLGPLAPPGDFPDRKSEQSDRAWRSVMAIGIALLVMGVTDLALLLVQSRFGDLEWEFGSVSAMLNGLPVPAMGGALILASGLARDEPVPVLISLTWSVTLTLVLLASTILYVLNAPIALRSVADPAGQSALKAALLKGSVALVTYSVLHVTLVLQAARFLRKK